MPKGSDVELVQDLFSKKQLAQLGFLKYLIKQETIQNVRKSLLLSFSSTVNKINLTYHHSTYAGENAGDSSPMRYYRYRIAPQSVDLDFMKTFEKKVSAIINAKREIEYKINSSSITNLQVVQGTATNLDFIKKESVDYIYTDPPYGKRYRILIYR